MTAANSLLSYVRRLRPVDLILPIGAALVSAGLQNLADRETRQRNRLDELAELANDHLTAFAGAGVRLPDGLVATEEHPLDPGIPWLSQHAGPETDGETEPAVTRRPWKLAALGLAAATGVTLWNHREQIGQRLGIALGYPYGPDEVNPDLTPSAPTGLVCGLCSHPIEHHAAASCAGDDKTDCDCSIGQADGTEPVRPNHSMNGTVSAEPADEPDAVSEWPTCECGWPNCDWTSDPTKSVSAQATAAAVHRNRCIYRPAGAGVAG